MHCILYGQKKTTSKKAYGQIHQSHPCTRLCFLNELGGHWSAINSGRDPKSCIKVRMSKIENEQTLFNNSNSLVKWWINKAVQNFGVLAHDAVRRGDIYTLEILMDTNGNPNETDRDGMTPLHIAAQVGHVNCLRVLIEFDADLDVCNMTGETAMHVAVQLKNEDCVPLL